MQRYSNLSGQSGIKSYTVGSNYIDVYFSDGAAYRYTYASAGSTAIEQMKQLAASGRGLNSYINRYVKYDYAVKLQ